MFKLMGKEINAILCAQMVLIWTYDYVKVPFSKHQYCCRSSYLLQIAIINVALKHISFSVILGWSDKPITVPRQASLKGDIQFLQ